jgi:integrase
MLENTTILQTIGAFKLYLYREGKSTATEKAYIADIKFFRDFLKSELNNKVRYVHQISLVEIRQYKDYLLTKMHKGRIKRATVDRKFNALKTYFTFLEKEHDITNIIKNDPFSNRKLGKDSGRDYLPNYLKPSEIKVILDTIKGSDNKNKYRDYAIFQILINLGCRRSEVLALKWNDIDFYEDTIQITREKTSNADILPLPSSVKTALLDYRDTLVKTGDYVFRSRESEKLSVSTFTSTINKWVQESGIEEGKDFKITAHTFRHSFITLCVKNNVPTEKIMRYTGHKDRESLDIYTHLKVIDLKDTNNLIESVFNEAI